VKRRDLETQLKINQQEKTMFELGEVVKLKSGGPDMTVKAVPTATTKRYYCQWFAGKKLEQGEFPPESLEKVPPRQP
jgi:uncharacterized protein YodC (DUF2158 family)